MEHERNWAGNYKYNASAFLVPESIEQVQEWVARGKHLRVLGTRHSFNGIADCTDTHLSLQKLNRVVELDPVRQTVTVQGGIRYGELSHYLHQHGYALHNLASLPHITVAGAIATATHGSGDRNGNLGTVVRSMEIVTASGEKVVFSRDDAREGFAGAVVGLGALGVVAHVTLDVIPSFEMTQHVYDNLPLAQLENHFDDIYGGGYSVSLFTDWKQPVFNQLWIKRKHDQKSTQAEAERFGAALATARRHPVPGLSAESCTEQLGVPGAWHERMPHFRMDFTPSAGDELQSEYFVPRRDAYDALCAIERIRERVAPLLHVSEVRSIAADELWMSPCFKQDTVGIHFTWKADGEAVSQVLPLVEKQLEPFQARPHWGKLFAMEPAKLQSLYAKLPDFRELLLRHDPDGKFRNAYLNEYIMGELPL